MSLPYYKKYPRDFIEGTIGMSLELKGAYALVLDLIYMQDGQLPDDAKYISGLLGCSVKKWNSLRKILVETDKIYVSGNFLSNYRADKERETLRKFQQNQSEKASNPRKNNNLAGATVKPARVKPEPEPDNTTLQAREEIPQIREMLDALGITDETKIIGLLQISEPLNWLNSGCKMQEDILPALRQIASRPKTVTNWNYCRQAVFEARDRRLAPSPQVTAPISKPAFSKSKSVASLAIENAMRSSNG